MSANLSFDDSTMSSGKRLMTSGAGQIGGGSFLSYLQDHMDRMYKDIEATTRKLELEQRRLYQSEKELQSAETEFTQKRAKFTKLNQAGIDDAVAVKYKEVHRLELQLKKAIADLDQGNFENENLRQQIDQHRRERKLLDSVFRQQQKLIAQRERDMKKLLSNVHEDKTTVEDTKNRGKALTKMLERERKGFHGEIHRMKDAVDKERDVQKEQEKLSTHTGSKSGRPYMVADEEEAFSFKAKQRQILKISFLNTCQRRHIKQHQKNNEVIDQAFATIKSTTGISNIDEIVRIFVALEQRNYSLLTFVNQLNRDIESTDIRNRELKKQLEKHQQEQEQAKGRKEKALAEVNAQIARTKAAAAEKDKMVRDLDTALVESRDSIKSVVRSLDTFMKQGLPKLMNEPYDSGELPPMKASPPDEQEEHLNNHLMYIEEALLQFRDCLSKVGLQRAVLQGKPPNGDRRYGPRQETLPSAKIHDNDSDDDPETGLGEEFWNRKQLLEKVRMQGKKPRKGQGGVLRSHVQEAAEEAPPERAAPRRDAGPPPPKADYAASSVTSRESGYEQNSGSTNLSKSPSVSVKQQAPGPEGMKESPQEDEADGDREKSWWSGKGKEKKK
jgi:hypothetical protein